MTGRPALLLPLLLLAGLLAVLPAPMAAQTPLRGAEGRVIILDASGSMRQSSFSARPRSRWEQAILSLEELVSQLSRRNDGILTAFHVFGDRFRWEDVESLYASPNDYPADGPLCQDTEVRTGFEAMSPAAARRILAEAEGATPSGMTPIPLALGQALGMLDPGYGGTIILISDMDSPNCLPPGETLCSAIEDMLEAFRRPDGRMLVEFRVLATPVAGLGASLADCAPTTTFELAVAAPDHEQTVSDLLGGVEVTVRLRVGGENVVDPLGIDPEGISVFVVNTATGREVATGPLGRLALTPGTYEFRATGPTGTWRRTEAVSAAGAEVEIEVDAGSLRISAVDASGAPVTTLSRLEVARADGTVVLSEANKRLPFDVGLGRGTYEVRASAPGLGDGETRVPVELAAFSSAVLQFEAQGTAVEVTLDVAVPQPTLPGSSRFDPAVVLSGGNLAAPLDLAVGSTVLNLEPGRYVVTVASGLPHLLTFEIPWERIPYRVDVLVPPGRFVAEVAEVGGQFELLDGSGIPLHSFEGARISHSLASGSYRLVYRRGDGTMTRRQDFTLGPGDFVEFEF